MIIKKFQGKTEEEAVLAAKKELGDGIVIMNVKSVITNIYPTIYHFGSLCTWGELDT